MVDNWNKLTEKQKDIYDLYFNQGLSYSEIAYRRQTTRQAVYNLVKKIAKKIIIPIKIKGGLQKGDTVIKKGVDKKGVDKWRFHALHFIVKPFYFYPRYRQMLQERGNYGIREDKFTIMLYQDRIRIQSREGTSWTNEDKLKAIQEAEEDFNRFLYYASHKYGFEYEKDGRISIRLVSSELARENSIFAKDYTDTTGENTLRIKDQEGKVFFVIDHSKAEFEHEYIGKNTYSNAERVEPYIQDFLINNPMTNTELSNYIKQIVILQKEQAAGLTAVINLIKPISVVNETPTTDIKTKIPEYIG